MKRSELHLVNAQGRAVSPAIKTAVETVLVWVLKDFPNIDPAMISEWAEDVAWAMDAKEDLVTSFQRYAYVALKGRVRDWLRTMAGREESAGVGTDLERLTAQDRTFQRKIEQKVLFDQIKASLNERDRYILVLLLRGETNPAVTAQAFGISYAAAAKAIQRVKERITGYVKRTSRKDDFDQGSPQFCETKG